MGGFEADAVGAGGGQCTLSCPDRQLSTSTTGSWLWAVAHLAAGAHGKVPTLDCGASSSGTSRKGELPQHHPAHSNLHIGQVGVLDAPALQPSHQATVSVEVGENIADIHCD
jgi:hypothetical protein